MQAASARSHQGMYLPASAGGSCTPSLHSVGFRPYGLLCLQKEEPGATPPELFALFQSTAPLELTFTKLLLLPEYGERSHHQEALPERFLILSAFVSCWAYHCHLWRIFHSSVRPYFRDAKISRSAGRNNLSAEVLIVPELPL